MAIGKIIGISLGTICLGSGTVGALYGATKETVLTKLKNQILLSEELSDWKILEDSIKDKDGLPQEVSSKIKTNNSGEDLKKWCKNEYEKVLSVMFKTYANKDLAEKYCVLNIETALGDKAIKEETQNTEILNKNVGSLNNATEDKNKVLGDLQKTKPQTNSNVTNEELLNWCKSKYSLSYQINTQESWIMVNKYCKKN